MSPAYIAWLATMALWLLCTTVVYFARKHYEYEIAMFATIMQFICLGFMWLFLGLSNNWW